jgi:hypothetical protein
MNPTLKVAIGIAAALVVGFIVGYGLGASGRSEAEKAQKREKRRADEAEAALKQQVEECTRKSKAARRTKHVLLTKEHLLRAAVEIYDNNYGLASQHLAHARKRLKSASRSLKKRHAKRAHEIYEKIGGAQTLAMRLDPNSRVHIVRILRELSKLPGAR